MCPRKLVVKKSQEERREETRVKILNAAMDLFFEQGYDETTTREIIYRAGILNGTLYNRFKSKEDILLSLVSDGQSEFMKEAETVFKDSKNPIVAFVLPSALEIYIASRSAKAADLIYAAHKSWAAVAQYTDSYLEWASAIMPENSGKILSDELLRKKVIAMVGATGNIAAMCANGMSIDFDETMSLLIRGACAIFDIQAFDVRSIVEEMSGYIVGKDVSILGHRLSEFSDFSD